MNHFLARPPFRSIVRTIVLASAFGAGGVAAFFLWFDAQMCTFRAVHALEEVADVLEHDGKLGQAEAVIRQIALIKQHQAVGPLFPGGLLPYEYYLEPRLDLSRVLMERGRLGEALGEYERLLADAATALGRADPYYAWISSNYGECLARAGRLASARAALAQAQPLLSGARAAENLERLHRLASPRGGVK